MPGKVRQHQEAIPGEWARLGIVRQLRKYDCGHKCEMGTKNGSECLCCALDRDAEIQRKFNLAKGK
jgi:hypothetical protein